MNHNKTGAIGIFVKTPGLSPTKTRLAASIGSEAAQEFHLLSSRATEAAVKRAVTSSTLTPYWVVAEKAALHHPLWKSFQTVWQGDGELGDRLAHVYEELIQSHAFVIFIGADSPELSPKVLTEAVLAISHSDGPSFVLGRAEDGGFYLFGGTSPIPREIWLGVPYSQTNTATELAVRIKQIGNLKELPILYDVDTVEDLKNIGAAKDPSRDLLPEQETLLSYARNLLDKGQMKSILFLCVANSARSQMAEGLARRILDSGVRVQSAGSKPTNVNPFAVRALAEIGIDIQGQTSKSIESIDMRSVDLIVTLCQEEICPILPLGVRRLHWPIQDPTGMGLTDVEKLKHFCNTRDMIGLKLQELRKVLIES